MAENTLYFGDNLYILRDYIADESVDLIYLDPPFNSNQAYNVRRGSAVPANHAVERRGLWGRVAVCAIILLIPELSRCQDSDAAE